jgi:hypothetical protein
VLEQRSECRPAQSPAGIDDRESGLSGPSDHLVDEVADGAPGRREVGVRRDPGQGGSGPCGGLLCSRGAENKYQPISISQSPS